MIKKIKYIILATVISLLLQTTLLAQRDSTVQLYFQTFRSQLDSNKVEEAQSTFKSLASLKTTLPDEVAYYYGVLTYKQKKYPQSKAAFEKYLKLRNDSSKLCSESRDYLEKLHCLEHGFRETDEICSVCKGNRTVPGSCEHCKKTGIELCMLCRGQGVIEEKNNFGKTFRTCPKCSGEKYETCSVCKGSKTRQLFCPECSGFGKKRIKLPCHE